MQTQWMKAILRTAIVGVVAVSAQAGLISNGDFEANLTGWTRVVQPGSRGNFWLQSGTASPINRFPVPAPPDGTRAIMMDALGPGSRVIYQDFAIPALFPAGTFTFSLFLNNMAPDYVTADSLDFATPALNQQFRADLMLPSANPFSVNPSDILQNLFQTQPGHPLLTGYTVHSVAIDQTVQAFQGQTVRLRFASVDNVAPFNIGIDAVDILPVPEPSAGTLSLIGLGLVFGGWLGRRRLAG